MNEDKPGNTMAAIVKVKTDLHTFHNETLQLVAEFTKLGLYIRNGDEGFIRGLLNEEIEGTSLELLAPVIRVSAIGAIDKAFQVIADNLRIRAGELGIRGNLSSGESSPDASTN